MPSFVLTTIFCLGSLLLSQSAYATLGENSDSVSRVQKAFNATKKPGTSSINYTVEVLTSPGSVIKEYLSKDGTVFAVTWKGLSRPNLALLFGQYYQEFAQASELKQRTLSIRARRETIHGSSIQVFRSRHGHDNRGLAYVTSLLPAGVQPKELQP